MSNETQPAQRTRSQQLNYKSTIYFYSHSAHPLSSEWLNPMRSEPVYYVFHCMLNIYKNHKLQTGHK